MAFKDEKSLHETVGMIGLRAQATAIGLLQLSAELVNAGVLDCSALERIKTAIVKDLSLTRPRRREREEYEREVRQRLDHLFARPCHEQIEAQAA
jgi:hypothetical protein